MEQGNGDINGGTLWASCDIAALIVRERITPNAPRLPFHR